MALIKERPAKQNVNEAKIILQQTFLWPFLHLDHRLGRGKSIKWICEKNSSEHVGQPKTNSASTLQKN